LTQSLSASLQGDFRFFHFPLPALPQPSLRSACHCWQRVGFTVFRLSNTNGLGSVYLPVVDVPVVRGNNGLTSHVPSWFKPVSIFGLLSMTEFINSSHYVSLTTQPSSLPQDACRFVSSSRTRLTSFEDGIHCTASFIPPRCQVRMWRWATTEGTVGSLAGKFPAGTIA
jgi:hypothetical protein